MNAAIIFRDVVDNTMMVVLTFSACQDRFVLSKAFVRVFFYPDSPAIISTFTVRASTLAFVTHLWRC